MNLHQTTTEDAAAEITLEQLLIDIAAWCAIEHGRRALLADSAGIQRNQLTAWLATPPRRLPNGEHAIMLLNWLRAQADAWELPTCQTMRQSDHQTIMNTYSYATDSGSGTVDADSLEEAYDDLREEISDAMIEDGAKLWVEDADGVRLTMGIDRD